MAWHHDFANWWRRLAEPAGEDALLFLRRITMMSLPCCGAKLIRKLEKRTGSDLRYKPQRRPKKVVQV